MITALNYTLYKNGEEHRITITSHNKTPESDNVQITGVFALSDAGIDIGDIVFDDNMNQWEYTGMGTLTHEEAAEIAGFIQKNKLSENN
jgi:hypothetical protein